MKIRLSMLFIILLTLFKPAFACSCMFVNEYGPYYGIHRMLTLMACENNECQSGVTVMYDLIDELKNNSYPTDAQQVLVQQAYILPYEVSYPADISTQTSLARKKFQMLNGIYKVISIEKINYSSEPASDADIVYDVIQLSAQPDQNIIAAEAKKYKDASQYYTNVMTASVTLDKVIIYTTFIALFGYLILLFIINLYCLLSRESVFHAEKIILDKMGYLRQLPLCLGYFIAIYFFSIIAPRVEFSFPFLMRNYFIVNIAYIILVLSFILTYYRKYSAEANPENFILIKLYIFQRGLFIALIGLVANYTWISIINHSSIMQIYILLYCSIIFALLALSYYLNVSGADKLDKDNKVKYIRLMASSIIVLLLLPCMVMFIQSLRHTIMLNRHIVGYMNLISISLAALFLLFVTYKLFRLGVNKLNIAGKILLGFLIILAFMQLMGPSCNCDPASFDSKRNAFHSSKKQIYFNQYIEYIFKNDIKS